MQNNSDEMNEFTSGLSIYLSLNPFHKCRDPQTADQYMLMERRLKFYAQPAVKVFGNGTDGRDTGDAVAGEFEKLTRIELFLN